MGLNRLIEVVGVTLSATVFAAGLAICYDAATTNRTRFERDLAFSIDSVAELYAAEEDIELTDEDFERVVRVFESNNSVPPTRHEAELWYDNFTFITPQELHVKIDLLEHRGLSRNRILQYLDSAEEPVYSYDLLELHSANISPREFRQYVLAGENAIGTMTILKEEGISADQAVPYILAGVSEPHMYILTIPRFIEENMTPAEAAEYNAGGFRYFEAIILHNRGISSSRAISSIESGKCPDFSRTGLFDCMDNL